MKPSPSQPRPCAPMISTVSSERSCAIFMPTFFMIEVVALGPGLPLRLGGGAAHGQAQRLRLHLVGGEARAQVGVGQPASLVDADIASWPASPRPLASRAGPPPSRLPMPLRSCCSSRLAIVQPPFSAPDQVLLRRLHVGEEGLALAGGAGDHLDRPRLDAGRMHVDQDEADALVLLGRVGAARGRSTSRRTGRRRSRSSGR